MCFDSCTINIRASIRVRGMHLVLGAEPVKINRVPKTVPEKVWEALVQSQVRLNRVPEKVPEKVEEKVPEKVPEKVWEALVQSQVSRVPKKVPEKVPGSFFWVQSRSSSTGFQTEKVWEALVQSQVRFNRVPEKVPEKVEEKVPGGFGAEPGQVQQGSGEGSREGLGGFGAEPGQVQRDLRPFNSRKPT